jgi:hypothetical protein
MIPDGPYEYLRVDIDRSDIPRLRSDLLTILTIPLANQHERIR